MSKELEALKRFKDNIRWLEENTSLKSYFENSDLHLKEDLDTIKTALKDSEKQHQIDIDLLGTIYKINIQNQKKLQALEIIKKKNVDIGYFRKDFVKNNYGFDLYEEYPTNYHYGTDDPCFEYKGEFLTREEFDLLKEVLLWVK